MIKTSIKISKDGPLGAIFVSNFSKFKNKFQVKFKSNKKFRITFLISIVIVVIALILVVNFCLNNPKRGVITDNTLSEILTYSTDNPSEEPPGKDFVWKGNSLDPKYIKLPSVGIEGFIQNVGVDQNSQIAVPNNVHFAGWFVDTVKPGEVGLSIIDGHLNGTSRGGIFRNLEKLTIGDEFSIEMGNGNINTFKVKEVRTLDLDDAVDFLFSQQTNIMSQLNLITCGGTYNKEARIYEQRVIVISEHIGN